jgi:phosphonate transport system substrate-binding protein
MNDTGSRLSFRRVLLVVVPVAILAIAAYLWSRTLESKARESMSENVFARILASQAAAGDEMSKNVVGAIAEKGGAAAGTAMKYTDKDGDFVADSPDDPAKCIDPQVLMFSFVAGETESVPEEKWKEVLAALGEKTGREVKYIHYATMGEQLAALKNGELHIAGLNTGNVPLAVVSDGFVPLCTFGREDGTYGYTMQVLVPADSPIKEIEGVKGRKVTMTRPDSNSGCKALLMLLNEKGLRPDRDFAWGFSLGHEESIKGVAAKDFEVVSVASDILQRMEEQGEVEPEAIRTIYESERFPPATIGYVYHLTPELRTAIREVLVGFNLVGTGLEGEFGADATKLVAVDYKNDWASARRIDQLIAQARTAR